MAEPISNSTTRKSASEGVMLMKGAVSHLNKRAVFFSRIKRRILKHIWLARLGIIAGIIIGVYLIFSLVGLVFKKEGIMNYPALAYNFIFAPSSKIKSLNGRTNIIVLGKSGAGHAGADLTDTVLFVSVSLNNSSVSLISIPRDIWIPAIRAKINSAYYWGNQKQPGGGGLILAKSEVEEVIGQPVQYGVVLDFNGFKKIIDAVGGIDVFVERSFVDEKYPIAGRENDTCTGDSTFACRYETVKFEKGLAHMDGDTALKFVRSRNAPGDEGTDLARGARQEKVISALKDKVLNVKTLLNIEKDITIWNIVRESAETDITQDAAAVLVRKILDAKDKTTSQVIPENLLENPPVSLRYDNQYVFIPKGGTWDDVHSWVQKLLETK